MLFIWQKHQALRIYVLYMSQKGQMEKTTGITLFVPFCQKMSIESIVRYFSCFTIVSTLFHHTTHTKQDCRISNTAIQAPMSTITWQQIQGHSLHQLSTFFQCVISARLFERGSMFTSCLLQLLQMQHPQTHIHCMQILWHYLGNIQ